MPLGLTREEAAYLLSLIEFDIIKVGGIEKLKEFPEMRLVDVDCLIRQLEIIIICGDSAKDRKEI